MINVDEINILVTDFLENEDENIMYLKLMGTPLKKYIGKNEYLITNIKKYPFQIKRVIVSPTNIFSLFHDLIFKKQLTNVPSTITHIKFGYFFNSPVDNLP